MSPARDGSDVVQVKLEFELPADKCIARLSRQHPDVVFKNMSMLPVPREMGNTLIEVNGTRARALLDDLDGDPNVESFKIVLESPDQVLVNMRVADPVVLKLISAHHLLIDFPLVFENGKGSMTLIGERKDVDALLDEMARRGIPVTLKSIGGSKPSEILTEKQKEVLVKAIKAGFFEVPRRVSLSSLASEFDVSPTALSEMMRRLSKKLAEHYIESTF